MQPLFKTVVPWLCVSAASAAPSTNSPHVNEVVNKRDLCSQSAPCVGAITWYGGGLGACGLDVDTSTDYALALPVGMMGDLSNTNPLCGLSVTVMNPVTGTKVSGVVRDKCMGCQGQDLDLTNVFFNSVTDGQGDGRVSGMQWWFN